MASVRHTKTATETLDPALRVLPADWNDDHDIEGLVTTEDLALTEEWAPNFTAAGDLYIPARVAMTISQGNAKIGTGTLAFTKSTAAAPSTFGAATLPVTLEAGAWLKVSASAVTGFVATHLKRTA